MLRLLAAIAVIGAVLAVPVVDLEVDLEAQLAQKFEQTCQNIDFAKVKQFFESASDADWKDTDELITSVTSHSDGTKTFKYNGKGYTRSTPQITVKFEHSANKITVVKTGGNLECKLGNGACTVVSVGSDNVLKWEAQVSVYKTLKWWAKGLSWIVSDIAKHDQIDLDVFCGKMKLTRPVAGVKCSVEDMPDTPMGEMPKDDGTKLAACKKTGGKLYPFAVYTREEHYYTAGFECCVEEEPQLPPLLPPFAKKDCDVTDVKTVQEPGKVPEDKEKEAACKAAGKEFSAFAIYSDPEHYYTAGFKCCDK